MANTCTIIPYLLGRLTGPSPRSGHMILGTRHSAISNGEVFTAEFGRLYRGPETHTGLGAIVFIAKLVFAAARWAYSVATSIRLDTRERVQISLQTFRQLRRRQGRATGYSDRSVLRHQIIGRPEPTTAALDFELLQPYLAQQQSMTDLECERIETYEAHTSRTEEHMLLYIQSLTNI